MNPDGPSKSRTDAADPAVRITESFSDQLSTLVAGTEYAPAQLIDLLKTDERIAEYLAQPAVREGYTIEEHTLIVLRQFEKYFANRELPGAITREDMRVLLAFHDIGKGICDDRSEQHTYTLEVLKNLHEEGVFQERTYQLMSALLEGDPIGRLFSQGVDAPSVEEKLALAQKIERDGIVESDVRDFASAVSLRSPELLNELVNEAATSIKGMAAKANLSGQEMLAILAVYFQSDSLAYTLDAPRDHVRSPVLTVEAVSSVKFNGDKPLDETPGLTTIGSELSWEVYARLQQAGKQGAIFHFPLERSFPSLDIIYELLDTPDFGGDPTEVKLFRFDEQRGRLQFTRPYEEMYALLSECVA